VSERPKSGNSPSGRCAGRRRRPGHRGDQETTSSPSPVADAIVELSLTTQDRREERFLRVQKLRGSSFRSGRHAYRIDRSGLQLFPRLADTFAHGTDDRDYHLGDRRASSGIAAVDDMLAQGYRPGTCTLITGPSGWARP